jgi:hypothetical protein
VTLPARLIRAPSKKSTRCDRSAMGFLFEGVGDYRPRPLMQIG